MKNKGLRFLLFMFASVLCFIGTFGFFAGKNFAVAEEEEKISYDLIPKNYNSEPSETLSKYNIENKNLDWFTPFDYETNTRMTGSSFKFDEVEDSRHQIDNQYVLTDRVENISFAQDQKYALSVWIYFDNVSVHDLTLSLELENGSVIKWVLTSYKLTTLLNKTSYDIIYIPFSWNRIILPFDEGVVSGGGIKEGENLSPVIKMNVSYKSELEQESMSSLLFYNPTIEQVDEGLNISAEKQGYTIGSFNFFKDEVVNSICVGDSISLPSKSSALNFAWQGRRNLLLDKTIEPQNQYVQWKVYLSYPSGGETKGKTLSFGDKIDFDGEGSYTIYYRCYDRVTINGESSEEIILSGYQTISVSTLNAIYFDKSKMNVTVGETYVLNINTSSLFTSVSDLSFEFDSSCLSLISNSDGTIEVKTKKAGTFNIKAKVVGSRAGFAEDKEYETSIQIVSKKSQSDKNHTLRIVIYVLLGIFGVALLVSLVILLVKSRKISVK